MSDSTVRPDLLEYIDAGHTEALRRFVEEHHPAQIAEAADALDDADIWRVLSALEKDEAADVFSHFDMERQVELASGAHRPAMARMLEALPPDDRADLVRQLDSQVTEQILPLVAKAEREDIRKLASYEEGTAGSLMSSDYATLSPDQTVAQALERIRVQAPTRETVYYLYVVDPEHRLIGFVSLKDLILTPPQRTVRDIMHEDALSVDVNEDQEHVARVFEKYDLLAIPVVNGNNKLVGIITHDDVLDVIRQEQQEDVEKLMAIGGRHETGDYMRMPAREHFRNRVLWVAILAVIGLLAGMIVQQFEEMLAVLPILVVFLPMLVDTGGNTGSQSATLVVRALALNEIEPRDVMRVLFKELRISVMIGLVLSAMAFGRVVLLGGVDPEKGFTLTRVGFAIAIALGLQVISATLIGAALPLIAAAFKKDPAVVASPALTTIVDITGLLLFFFTVQLMLGL